MSSDQDNVDVIVIGGGPGGSTVSTLLAKTGNKVIQLEKAKFPRYQIGESLLPSTIHGVCKLLGVEEELREASFVTKRGGIFRWGKNKEPWNFLFAISPEFSNEASYAYQVERMKFDDILLKNAAQNGVDVRQQAKVRELIRGEGTDRVTGVRYEDADGQSHSLSATYVVDASGNGSRFTSAPGGKRKNADFFQNVATFGYFEGGKRFDAPDSGNILCAAFDHGWIWYIPLSDTLTSVGAVLDKSHLPEISKDKEKALLDSIDRCAIVKDMLSDATRVTEGTYGEMRVRKDYSYSNSKFWGNGVVLVGDAACFIDPVFSTGVHLATYAGVLAARSINSVLSGALSEERAFGEFEGRYRREYEVFYEFLSTFYDMEQEEDSYFWQARRISNLRGDDLSAFVSLIAGGYSGEQALVNPEEIVERFTASTRALADAAEKTGSMHTDSGQRMGHLFGTENVRDVMEEMNAFQARGAEGSEGLEPPLLEGGLVPSRDGLAWAEPEPAVQG
ncbi:tryptophan 7-halogenase [Corynebacterium neomassiliense]|uniref:tryptophan 7-halogenase n=1 Tax=Corynebacterium neomassiliense TaxID=2079482 RepID=UPI00102F6B8C|nr:tryptophan 7-halogenase [Corynebacterium neomassiliense]